MTLQKRLRVGLSVVLCAAVCTTAAHAESALQPLSSSDTRLYAAAFEASDRGDFIDAQMQAVEIQDKSLLGYLSFRQLMHPSAHKASYDELAGWLARFRELPLAERIFNLAARRRPAEALAPPAPTIQLSAYEPPAPKAPKATPASDRGRPAREAFYSGDAARALRLAKASGERWIAGLAAWRLGDFADARQSFTQVADDQSQDAWLRSAGAYWAARSATAMGDPAGAMGFLRQAATYSETFYGMIAERQARMLGAYAEAPAAGSIVRAAFRAQPSAPDSRALAAFVAANPGAHRAAALAQLGRLDEARQELKAGLLRASSSADRESWTALLTSMSPALSAATAARINVADYPTPLLEPRSGFTVEKALVYAIVRQESRFNPLAVSHAGAVGLMQLMPEAAARAAGDDKLRADQTPLFEPSFNLRVGQDYLTWLMERGVGYDILRTVAAYNGGPGTLIKTSQMLGEQADSLLIIECLPSVETRNYVEKVMAGYWAYRRLWGQETPTLDAVAAGARFVDARLDLTEPGSATAQAAAQTLQIGLR